MSLGWNKSDRKKGVNLMITMVNEGVFADRPRLLSVWELLIKIYDNKKESKKLMNVSDLIPNEVSVHDRNKSGSEAKRAIADILDIYFHCCSKGAKKKFVINFQQKSPRLILARRLPSQNTDEQPSISSDSTYKTGYTLGEEDVCKEIILLKDKLNGLRNEKEFAEKNGQTGLVNVVNNKIKDACDRLAISNDTLLRIKSGYELWIKDQFEIECELAGFYCMSEILGKITNGIFKPNKELTMRIPDIHAGLKTMIDSKFFDEIVIYAVAEERDLFNKEVAPDPDNGWAYYMFGISYFDKNSLFY